MIPDDVVERVREEADIVSIVGEYVKLKRVGNSFRGPCPFHHGKNDNFSVTLRGGYKCFVCGESGDVFTFIQKHLGLDFVEAVKLVGAKAGVDVREVARRTEEKDSREPLWEINAAAAEFFRRRLWESPDGETAREYLTSRGLAREDADRFGIGYAPADREAIRDSLASLGFAPDRQLAAGLLVAREGSVEPRARFRHRLMFPIFDGAGHVVGFGGRVLGDGEPKYLNSAESEVFAKRKLLYGLNWAKQAIRKADRLIIVEGYFDVIRLMLAGITEAVAPLGTALTEDQAALIRKYTKNVFLLYDSDRAGLKATFRAGDILLAGGSSVRVITLPSGEDPDTFVAKFGTDAFEKVADASIDVYDRKIQLLERGGWFADLRRKRQALDKLLPTLRATADHLTRDLYVSRTSEVAGVSRDQLVRELSVAPRERRVPAETGAPPAAPEPAVRRRERRADRRAVGVRAERELVRLLLAYRRYVEATAERIAADVFTDPLYRDIFTELSMDSDRAVDELAATLDDDGVAVLQELLDEPVSFDRIEEAIDANINSLLARGIAVRMGEIDRLAPLANDAQKDDLNREKTRLAGELRALGRPRWKAFNSNQP
ncbi:MAG TPA: DNA primase [Gemmatimonadaceae bacterium]|nr:DNA primase [Gemmatimonadaceae bacterium]